MCLVCWRMNLPDWAQLIWSSLSSQVWRVCMERWDHQNGPLNTVWSAPIILSNCCPTVLVIEKHKVLSVCLRDILFNIFAHLFFRWEQRWPLTCWSMMKTPSLLFCVLTAGEVNTSRMIGHFNGSLFLSLKCLLLFSGVWWSCGAPWLCWACTRTRPVPSECCRSEFTSWQCPEMIFLSGWLTKSTLLQWDGDFMTLKWS